MVNFKLEKYLKCPRCLRKRVVAQVWKNRYEVRFILGCCNETIDKTYTSAEQVTRKSLKREIATL